MTDTEFKKERRKAFREGFLKGFAAPAMLFSPLTFPEREPMTPIDLDEICPAGGLQRDLEKISGDFLEALNRS